MMIDFTSVAEVCLQASTEAGMLRDLVAQTGGSWLAERVPLEPLDGRALAHVLEQAGADFPLHLADALAHVQELAEAPQLEAWVEAIRRFDPALEIDQSQGPWAIATQLWIHRPSLVRQLLSEPPRPVSRAQSASPFGERPVRWEGLSAAQ